MGAREPPRARVRYDGAVGKAEEGDALSPTVTIIVSVILFIVFVVPTYFLMDRWFKKRGDDEWGGPPG